MSSSKDTSTTKDAKLSESVQDADATEVFSQASEVADTELEAPATGYVYVSEAATSEEIDEALAAESLTKQLLRNGETIEKKPKSEKTKDEKSGVSKKSYRPVPGTAVGSLKGTRSSSAHGASALPTSSRTTEIGRGYQKNNKKKGMLPVVALSGGALALAAGGVAYALLSPAAQTQQTTAPVDAVVSSASPSASVTATVTAAPVPSIIDRVPEVKYMDPTESDSELGSVEYIEETPETEEPTAAETYIEEVQPTAEATIDEPTLTQAPTEDASTTAGLGYVASEGTTTVTTPTEVTLPSTNSSVAETPVDTVPTAVSTDNNTGAGTQGNAVDPATDPLSQQTAGTADIPTSNPTR